MPNGGSDGGSDGGSEGKEKAEFGHILTTHSEILGERKEIDRRPS
jgi:hypothetical protein